MLIKMKTRIYAAPAVKGLKNSYKKCKQSYFRHPKRFRKITTTPDSISFVRPRTISKNATTKKYFHQLISSGT